MHALEREGGGRTGVERREGERKGGGGGKREGGGSCLVFAGLGLAALRRKSQTILSNSNYIIIII